MFFELGAENRAEETKLVLVIIHCQIKKNSGTNLNKTETMKKNLNP